MKTHELTEREVLNKLNIPDFRHLTKEKVMSFASMLQCMDPEVAKKALEQFPDFANVALEALTDYKVVIDKALDKNSESSQQCYKLYDSLMDALITCSKQADITFEQRQYCINQMHEIAVLARDLDKDNKQFTLKMAGIFGAVIITVVGIGASVLGGNINFNIPKTVVK